MRRGKLTLWEATAVGLGNIIGAGIFVMAGSAINLAGPGALLAFIITALLAMSVGLNSAEMASAFPSVEGGVYSFARLTLGDSVGFLVGLLRVVSYIIGGAAVALGFSGYLTSLDAPRYLIYPTSITLIVALSILYKAGLKIASEFEKYLTSINIAGLAIFIVAGLIYSGPLKTSHFKPLLPHGLFGLIESSSLAFFAYSGFNTIATLTPSVKEGERNVPKAIMLSLAITTVIYILVVFTMLYIAPWQLYGTRPDPLSFALEEARAPMAIRLTVSSVALLSTFTVTLSMIIAGVRTMEQMAYDNVIPRSVARGNRPLLIVTIAMLISLALGNVETLGLVANFGVVFSYITTPIAVIVIRRRGITGSFKTPMYPILQILAIILSLLVTSALGYKSLEIGAMTLIVGILVYELHEEFNLIEKRHHNSVAKD